MEAVDLTPAVREALEELERDFGRVDAEPDETGGVYVRVEEVAAGDRWSPSVIPVEFQILFNYPYAAIYPFYTTPDLSRTDGGARPPALQPVDWRGRRLTQISLRSSRWAPGVETASSSVAQVRHWLQTTP